jgi:hypothetical protein
LPDIFYLRVAAALGGHLPGHKVLRSLLHPARPVPPAPIPSSRRG